jgi:hypothetical protein
MVKGVAVSNLILKWAGLSVADILLAPMGFSTIASQYTSGARQCTSSANQYTSDASQYTSGARQCTSSANQYTSDASRYTSNMKDDKEINERSIASTGAAIAVNVLDWFDNKLSSFFTPTPISIPETSPNTAVPPEMNPVNLTALLDKVFKYKSPQENLEKEICHNYDDYPLIIADYLERIAQRLVSVHIKDSFHVKGTETRTGTIVPTPPIGNICIF